MAAATPLPEDRPQKLDMAMVEIAIPIYSEGGFKLINLCRRSPCSKEMLEPMSENDRALLGLRRLSYSFATKWDWAFMTADYLEAALRDKPSVSPQNLYRGVDFYGDFDIGDVIAEKGFLSSFTKNMF